MSEKEISDKMYIHDYENNSIFNTKEKIFDSIEIIALFGYKNIKIDFRSNIRILIAENGAGKTTVLEIIKYIISGEFHNLLGINFSEIILNINKNKYTINKSMLKEIYNNHNILTNIFYLQKKVLSSSSHHVYTLDLHNTLSWLFLNEWMINDYEKNNTGLVYYDDNNNEMESALAHSLPFLNSSHSQKATDLKCLKNNELIAKLSNMREIIDLLNAQDFKRSVIILLQINKELQYKEHKTRTLYLTTSRGKSNINQENKYNSLTYNKIKEFNMKDVEERIIKLTDNIKQSINLSFIKITAGIVSQLVDDQIRESEISQVYKNSEDLKTILNRLHNNELISTSIFTHIEQIIKNKELRINRSLSYVLYNLMKEYQKQKDDDIKLKSFIKVCNHYLIDKRYEYDEINVKLSIKHSKNISKEINMKDLSSGEKQIVSLFSELYLGDHNGDKLALLFDEPELSLSIKWQEKLLPDIINSQKCGFIFVVTHSPFIIENELLQKELIHLEDSYE